MVRHEAVSAHPFYTASDYERLSASFRRNGPVTLKTLHLIMPVSKLLAWRLGESRICAGGLVRFLYALASGLHPGAQAVWLSPLHWGRQSGAKCQRHSLFDFDFDCRAYVRPLPRSFLVETPKHSSGSAQRLSQQIIGHGFTRSGLSSASPLHSEVHTLGKVT